MNNRRLILLFIFSFSLVLLWGEWQSYKNPSKDLAEQSKAEASAAAPVPTTPVANIVSSSNKSSVPSAIVQKSELVQVSTDLFTATISAQGGDVVDLKLKEYKGSKNKDEPFQLFESKHQYVAQSGLIGEGLPTHKTHFKIVGGDRELAAGSDTVQLRLEAPAKNGVKVSKIYTFNRDSYLIELAQEIENGTQKEIAAHAYYQLQRDTLKPEGGQKFFSSVTTGPAVYTEEEKYQKIAFDDIQDGDAEFNPKADNGWVAMVQHYFVSAWIPKEKQRREFYVRSFDNGIKPVVDAGVIVQTQVVAAGAKARETVSLYAGPQIQDRLKILAKPVAEGGIGADGLPLVVDYGMLTIIAVPIFWCLGFIHDLVGNWGWAIVLLTLGIKILFFPLSAASYRSMAKMKAVSPIMASLRERYGHDKQRLNAEMMNLYKTRKINPLGGCLPLIVQMPVFIALYWALMGAVEMRDAPWIFWIKDLSAQDPFYILPLIMMGTMMIQTKLNPTPPDPTQAKVTAMMPYFFGVMFMFFPAGLVLYWVVNNTLSIAQQWQITRMIEGGKKVEKGSGA